jgi:arylsulfatase A-like enzyme
MYDPAAIPEPPSFVETWERKPMRHKVWEEMWGLSRDGWRGWREIVARYWGYVTMLDELTGRILAELRALGLEESTLVVFSTDHGDMMGAHRMIEKGPFGYEEAYRLPLVVTHPDCARPGSANDDLVYLQDLFPTFLELAGADVPAGCDHVSIVDQILGRDASTGRTALFAHGGHGVPKTMRVLRTKTHKLVLTPSAEGIAFDAVNDVWQVLELYDLVRDPDELCNLADCPGASAKQAELLDLMRQQMAATDDPLLSYLDVLPGR